MKKVFKRVTSVVVAVAMAAGLAVTGGGIGGPKEVRAEGEAVQITAPTKFDSASDINYATILGGAVDYGIVAETIVQNNHMETTFATNKFINNSANNDVDFIHDKAVHFIIGSLGNNNSGNLSEINFGKTSASSVHVEAPSAVIGNYDGKPHNISGGKNGNFKFSDGYPIYKSEDEPGIPLITNINENATSNVERLIDKIKGEGEWSDNLSLKANDNAYNLDVDNYISYTNKGTDNAEATINLEGKGFENKVVYINVDSDLAKAISSTQPLTIKKDSSTVIVFNIEEGVLDSTADKFTLGKVLVHTGNKSASSSTDTNGGSAPQDNTTESYTGVDSELCQKIIWNVRTNKKVDLNTTGGTILLPYAPEVKLSSGNCCGWIISGGTVDVSNEFHYMYQGGSRDGYGEMHFYLRKGFVNKYGSKTQIDDKNNTEYVPYTSIDINDGDFAFLWQEYTNNEFNVTKGSAIPCEITSAGVVRFPVLNFTSDLPNNATSDSYDETEQVTLYDGDDDESNDQTVTKYYKTKEYYYKITEDPSKQVSGIENSAGYISITLKARRDEGGNFTYIVNADMKSGEDADNLVDYNTHSVSMSGVQFDLGAFYNKSITSLKIKKTVKGDYEPTSTDEYKFVIKGEDDLYYNENGTSSETEITVSVKANKELNVSNLPDQKYTVTEVKASAEREGYKLTATPVLSGEEIGKTVEVSASYIPSIIFTNTYEENCVLSVSKEVTGDNDDAKTQEFEFVVKQLKDKDGADSNVFIRKTVSGTFECVNAQADATRFKVVDGTPKVIKGLPEGTYQVIEITTYEGDEYEFTASYDKESVEVGTDNTANNPSTVKITNNYKAPKGTIVVNKTITIDGKDIGYNSGQINPGNITDWYNGVQNGFLFLIDGKTEAGFNYSVMQGSESNKTRSTEVLLGDYTVSEAGCPTITYNGETYVAKTTIDGDEVVSKDISITADGQTETVNIVNAYTKASDEKGKLVIKKTLSGETDLSKLGDIEFCFSPAIGNKGTITLNSDYASNGWEKEGNTYTYTFEDLTVGAKYTVEESSNGAGTNYTCEVAPDKGMIKGLKIKADEDALAEFTNTYTAIGNFKLTKEVTSDETLPDTLPSFTVSLKAKDSEDKAVSGSFPATGLANGTAVQFNAGVAVVQISDDGSITISGLPAGTVITASEPDVSMPEGFTCETTGDNLKATIAKGTTSTVALVNKYESTAPETGKLSIKKVVTGTGFSETLTFPIKVKLLNTNQTVDLDKTYAVTGYGSVNEVKFADGTYTFELKHNQEVTIEGIPVNTTYTVTETMPTTAAYADYENKANTGDTAAIAKDVTRAVVVNNEYTELTPATVDLKATKTYKINGESQTLSDGQFNFSLTKKGETTAIETKGNDASGNIAFSTLTFDAEGTYEYVVKEVAGSDSSITYDDTAYNVAITVTKNTSTNALEATTVITKGSDTVTSMSFENTKTVSPTEATVDLKATKIYKINGEAQTLSDGQFNFSLTKKGETTAIETKGNDASGNIAFSTLTFDAEGTYEYVVKEVAGSDSSITYDDTAYNVAITVTKNTSTNALEATTVITKGSDTVTSMSFENTKTVSPTAATVDLKATKIYKINGEAQTLSDGQFNFSLTKKGETTAIETKGNDASGNIAFSTLTFDAEGTYEYVVKEVAGSDSSITYDDTAYSVAITVTKNTSTNALEATTVITKGSDTVTSMSFENTKTVSPTAATVDLKATKIYKINGESQTLSDGQFNFSLTKKGETTAIETKGNDASGNIAFSTLTFDAEGTYEYVVKEVAGSDSSITYDDTAYNVAITVTKNTSTNALEATTVITKGSDTVTSMSFENTKTVTPKAKLTVKKVETGDVDGSGKPSSYSFYVKSGSDYVQDATSGTLASTKPATPFTVAVSNTDGVVISGLDIDKTYTVEEVQVTNLNANYTCTPSYSPASFAATSTKTEETITITNKYVYTTPKASLTINKSVATDGANKDNITGIPTTFSIAVKHGTDYVQNTDGATAADVKYFDVTPGTPLVINGLLVGETYTIVEDENDAMVGVTPAADTSLSVTGTDSVTISADSTANVASLTNTYTNPSIPEFPVKISKKAVNGTDELSGAKLSIRKDTADGDVVKEWISDGSVKEFTLPAGTYVLVEDQAPTGYEVASSITFTVSDTGVISGVSTNVSTADGLVTMFDALIPKIDLQITKVDVANGSKEIAGAELTLYSEDASGNLTELISWISSATEVYTFKVTEGSFVIKETVAPKGYKKTDTTVTFDVVNNGGTLEVQNVGGSGAWNDAKQHIEFQNDPIKVSISKVDATNSEEVAGAKLVLTFPDGTKETWTSTTSKHIVEKTIQTGTYTLEETTAPEGYEKETTKMTFKVDEYGNVTDVTGPGEYGADGILRFKNRPLTGGLDILVRDEVTKEPVPNATVEVVEPDGTVKTYKTDKNGMITEYTKKDGSGKYTARVGKYTVTVKDVPPGYTVTVGKKQEETVVAGDVKHLISEVNTKTGGLRIRVIDEKTEEPVPDATVEVVKPDGTIETLTTDSDGYIRKFEETDEDGHYTAELGTYKITVTKVPEGYSVTTGETEEKTVVVGTCVEHIARIATATESKTDKTTTDTKTTTSKKTGDTTPIALVVILMGLSLAAATAIVIKRRKNRA